MGIVKEYTALVDPKRAALVVIDMQNDFCSLGGHFQKQGYDIKKIRSIIPAVKALIDDLPPEVKVIHVLTIREPDGSDNHWRRHKLLPERMRKRREGEGIGLNVVRGTWGAQVVEELTPRPQDYVFVKRRNSAFYQTDLEMCLRLWGIDTLIFCGVMAEICVESTIRDAFNRDFDIVVVENGVAGYSDEYTAHMLDLMRVAFGIVCRAEEVKNLFPSFTP